MTAPFGGTKPKPLRFDEGAVFFLYKGSNLLQPAELVHVVNAVNFI